MPLKSNWLINSDYCCSLSPQPYNFYPKILIFCNHLFLLHQLEYIHQQRLLSSSNRRNSWATSNVQPSDTYMGWLQVWTCSHPMHKPDGCRFKAARSSHRFFLLSPIFQAYLCSWFKGFKFQGYWYVYRPHTFNIYSTTVRSGLQALTMWWQKMLKSQRILTCLFSTIGDGSCFHHWAQQFREYFWHNSQ